MTIKSYEEKTYTETTSEMYWIVKRGMKGYEAREILHTNGSLTVSEAAMIWKQQKIIKEEARLQGYGKYKSIITQWLGYLC